MKKLIAPFCFGTGEVLILWAEPRNVGAATAVVSYTIDEGYAFVKIEFGGL